MSKSKSREAIKNLVKECLIEILAEGLVGSNKATISESRELRGAMQESYERSSRSITNSNLNQQTQVTQSSQPTPRRQSYLDSIKMGVDNSNKSEKQHVQSKVKRLTNDPIMSDILADTALTTLKEQKEGSRAAGPSVSRQGDQAAKVVDQSLPEELFGSSSSKWAELAFAPSIRK